MLAQGNHSAELAQVCDLNSTDIRAGSPYNQPTPGYFFCNAERSFG